MLILTLDLQVCHTLTVAEGKAELASEGRKSVDDVMAVDASLSRYID